MTSIFEPGALALILALAAATLLYAAWRDIKVRLIPNTVVLTLAFLFIPLCLLLKINPISHLIIFFVVFLFTFFCFHKKWLGGGDAKLIPVVALWVGLQGVLPFLLIMSLGGVFVAMGLMIVHHKRTKGAGGWKGLKLPYGVAIAVAGILVIGHIYVPALLEMWEAAA